MLVELAQAPRPAEAGVIDRGPVEDLDDSDVQVGQDNVDEAFDELLNGAGDVGLDNMFGCFPSDGLTG